MINALYQFLCALWKQDFCSFQMYDFKTFVFSTFIASGFYKLQKISFYDILSL